MKFPKDFLLGLLDLDTKEVSTLAEGNVPVQLDGTPLPGETEVEKVHTEDEGKVGRWSIGHSFVFRIGERHFQAFYTTGATESQDESPFEYDGPEVDCPEVRAVQVTTTAWVPIAPAPTKRAKSAP